MKVITALFEKDGRLYGKSDADGSGFNLYNLSRPGQLESYDYSNVVDGKELLEKYRAQNKESNA